MYTVFRWWSSYLVRTVKKGECKSIKRNLMRLTDGQTSQSDKNIIVVVMWCANIELEAVVMIINFLPIQFLLPICFVCSLL